MGARLRMVAASAAVVTVIGAGAGSLAPAASAALGPAPTVCDAYAPVPNCYYSAVSGTDTFTISTHFAHIGQVISGTYAWEIGEQGNGEYPAVGSVAVDDYGQGLNCWAATDRRPPPTPLRPGIPPRPLRSPRARRPAGGARHRTAAGRRTSGYRSMRAARRTRRAITTRSPTRRRSRARSASATTGRRRRRVSACPEPRRTSGPWRSSLQRRRRTPTVYFSATRQRRALPRRADHPARVPAWQRRRVAQVRRGGGPRSGHTAGSTSPSRIRCG